MHYDTDLFLIRAAYQWAIRSVIGVDCWLVTFRSNNTDTTMLSQWTQKSVIDIEQEIMQSVLLSILVKMAPKPLPPNRFESVFIRKNLKVAMFSYAIASAIHGAAFDKN